MRLRRLGVGLALLGLVVLTGCAVALGARAGTRTSVDASTGRSLHDSGSIPGLRSTSAAGPTPATTPGTRRASGASPAPPAADARLAMPRLHVDAPVVRVTLHGSVMHVPRDPGTVGWWSGGATPGATTGSAVIVGHVNYDGVSGALGHLVDAHPGDWIVLTHPDLRFRVTAIRSYAKSSGIPPAAFDAHGPAQLVLITCGGPFDSASGNYEDNIVVYAVRN